MRLIDVVALKEAMSKRVAEIRDLNASFYEVINEQPIVDAKPERHGYWTRPYKNKAYRKCSVCGQIHYGIPWNAQYCPFCGAKNEVTR